MEASRPSGPPQPDPMQQLMQIGGGYVLSAALWVAAELDIATLIHGGKNTSAQLAAATNTNADSLARVLRSLTVAGLFAEIAPNTFSTTPAAELLRSDIAGSQRDSIIWIADPFHLRVFSELMHSTRTGQPALEHVTGKTGFDFFASDPLENERFNAAMTSLSAMQVQPILEAYDFSPFKTLIDIGGGHGYLLCEVLAKYPNLRGVVFDIAHVLGDTRSHIAAKSVSGRCQALAGDFFTSVPEGGDAYLLKSIIHDWNDEKAGTILRNCRRALDGRPQGRLILVEMVRPADNMPHFSKLLDIQMLMFPGGRERTEEEFRALFTANGFRLNRIARTKAPVCVLEGVPV